MDKLSNCGYGGRRYACGRTIGPCVANRVPMRLTHKIKYLSGRRALSPRQERTGRRQFLPEDRGFPGGPKDASSQADRRM
jgi:hypothetical protein